jgi:MFS family permease
VPLVILAYILYQLTGAVAGPPWFSMMGEVVPESIRGKYFAWRNFLSVGTSVGTTILASVFLFYARSFGWLIYGFIVLFAIAAVARFISANYLRRHEVGPITFSKNYHFSFWRFLRRAPYNNFGRFSIFVAAFNFAVNIGGPFFGVYLWRDLGFNPIWYILITSSLGLFSALSMPVWGRLADRYGNRELLKLGSGLIAIGSLVWGFSRNPLYFIFVPELLFGVGWAAFNLATGNYIYDAVTPERRGLCLAYYSLLNGVGVFLGALTGGFLAEIITFSWINIFLRFIKEVRVGVRPPKQNPFDYLTEDIIPTYLPMVETIHLHVLGRFRGKKRAK